MNFDFTISDAFRKNIKVINPPNIEKNAAHLVKSNCKPFLEASGGNYGFHGLLYTGNILRVSMSKYKAPVDIPSYQLKDLDQAFTDFGYNVQRRNAFLMFGKKSIALTYGTPYVVFPIGDFDYLWSPKYQDVSKLYADKRAFELNPDRKDEIADKIFNDILILKYKDDVEHANTLPHNQKMAEISKIYEEISKIVENSISKFDKDRLSAYHTPRDFRISRDYIKRYYRYNSGLVEAIQSGHEIMIKCKSAYLVAHDVVKSALFKKELL